MKEINEKTVTRAKVGIVILGAVRGILYTVCAALTFLYFYFMLNAMNTNSNYFWGGWMLSAIAKLSGVDLERDFYRFDYSQYEGILDKIENIEAVLGPDWPSTIYFAVIIVSLVICVLLYFLARRMRTTVALSEKD